MTKDQYERLTPHLPALAGVRYNSVRLTPDAKVAVFGVYEELTGRKITASERTCSSCVLRVCRTLYDEALSYVAKKPQKATKKTKANA